MAFRRFFKIVQGHYEVIYIIFPIVVLTYLFAHRFTVIGMGEEMASSLGLSYAAIAAIGLILVAITVSTTVITVGAIPFVGLVVPNLVALKYGENLAKTLPIVALGGASLLLICDILGRSIIYPFEVPIGLTAGGVGNYFPHPHFEGVQIMRITKLWMIYLIVICLAVCFYF